MARDKFDSGWILEYSAGAIAASRVTEGRVTETLVETGAWPDEDALTEALRQFAKRHGLHAAPVIAVLPRHTLTVRTLEFPSTDPAEIAGMLSFSAADYVPYAASEITTAFDILGTAGSGKSEVLAYIARTGALERDTKRLRECGIEVADMIPAAGGLIAMGRNLGKGHLVLLHLCGGAAELLVFCGGTYRYGRAFELHDDLAGEVRRSLSAYEREQDEGQPERLFLSSATLDTDSAAKELAEGLEISCSPVVSQLAASLLEGLNAATPRNDSLLPPEETERRDRIRSREALRRTAVLACIVVAFLGAGFGLRLYQRSAYIEELQSRVEALEPQASVARAKLRHLQDLRGRIQRRETPLDLLAAISELAPAGQMSFTRFEYDAEDGIVLQGQARNYREFESLLDDTRAAGRTTTPLLARAHEMYRTLRNERGKEVWAFSIEIPFDAETGARDER